MNTNVSALDVIVIGGGISGLAVGFFARQNGKSVLVLEESTQAGGKIRTDWQDGFCCEWGPQGFLDNVPETLELVRLLGLENRLVKAGQAAADRFILRNGKLRKVPLSPPAFLASDVLSLPGKLRVLAEPFMPRGRAEDESVLAFARRRIGREAAEVLVDAMVTGVFAGRAAELSLPATFPKMAMMERTYGSLTRAMLALRKKGGGGPAGPGGTLTTFVSGMQELTDRLVAALGPDLRLQSPVTAVQYRESTASPWVVKLANGEELSARNVVVTVPPPKVSALFSHLFPPQALEALGGIPMPPVVVVMTAYKSPQPFAHPLSGFGFLVPSREPRQILGTLFCHSIFPNQAPEGTVLLRTILGGARQPEVIAFSDEELLRLVRRELHAILGGDSDPDLVRVFRHPEGIPQYTLGHLRRLAVLDETASRFRGLYLTGNAYRGVAVNACIAEAKKVAASLR
ncbi:MAG: protoporphyrinogen oxidase [Thermoanaerobaculum sp.]|nr:MAG: protoporphyrinogen oxidase [Thermoanaerobaculum sp.]